MVGGRYYLPWPYQLSALVGWKTMPTRMQRAGSRWVAGAIRMSTKTPRNSKCSARMPDAQTHRQILAAIRRRAAACGPYDVEVIGPGGTRDASE